MLPTTTTNILRNTLLTSSKTSSLLLRSLTTSTSKHLQITHEALQSHSEEVAENSKRAFQPHPTDVAPRPIASVPTTKRSHLHEDWLMYRPVYTAEEVNAVKIVRQERVTMTDKVASLMVKAARFGFDFVTRYKHASPEEALAAIQKSGKTELSLQELRDQGFVMTKEQWLQRILFLESVAGVPGFCAAMLRHLNSLRSGKRDSGWISTLLQEAENERMHLMTFMKIQQPSKFFRFLVIATQGVFCNMFFLGYMVAPQACHRFVAYLEEEAVVTYTQIAEEIKRGHLPEWGADSAKVVPNIARDYWRLPAEATMLDLILAVRADEASHRFVNHSLANLQGDTDVNPMGLKHPDVKTIGTLPGFTREESLEWCQKVEDTFNRAKYEEKMSKENEKH